MGRLKGGRTYVRTENLPILQDFVPYRGRCPKRSNVQIYGEYCSQRNAVQRDVKFAKDNYFRRKLEESKRDYGKLCNVTGMVMIDFRKVFDTCDHSILLCKLDCMGIGPD